MFRCVSLQKKRTSAESLAARLKRPVNRTRQSHNGGRHGDELQSGTRFHIPQIQHSFKTCEAFVVNHDRKRGRRLRGLRIHHDTPVLVARTIQTSLYPVRDNEEFLTTDHQIWPDDLPDVCRLTQTPRFHVWLSPPAGMPASKKASHPSGCEAFECQSSWTPSVVKVQIPVRVIDKPRPAFQPHAVAGIRRIPDGPDRRPL